MRKSRLREVKSFPHSFMSYVFIGQLSRWRIWRANPPKVCSSTKPCSRAGKRKQEISKWGRSVSLGRKAELINATGYDKDTAFAYLPPPALLPHTYSHAPRHTHKQLNKILEARVCLQVYFGVGGDFSLRLHPPSSPLKMCLIL